MTTRWPKLEILLVFGILALATFFRLASITAIPPGLYPDEAANGNNAVEALRTGNFKIFYPENNGREGLFINLQAIAIQLFGAEPWALRLVSAIFGTLTVLGIYLLTRELLSGYEIRNGTNIRNRFRNFVNNSYFVAILSAFSLATSYWHINFSRIGFRAILVPFFATFGLYWLLKALRTGKISSAVLGGVATGLGFHTYIAFRFMPFVLAIPIGFSLWQWFKRDANTRMRADDANIIDTNSHHPRGKFASFASPCTPCVVALFLFITLVTALPIGLYFLNHPQDFFGRGTQVSIFSAQSPIREFIKSTALTLGMFNFRGDCNQRHNLNCEPQLFWPVGILFIIGFAVTLARVAASKTLKATSGHGSPQSGESEESRNFRDRREREVGEDPVPPELMPGGYRESVGGSTGSRTLTSLSFGMVRGLWRVQKSSLGIFGRFSQAQPELILLVWFAALMLPATLTREGLPHALRAIGLIPPVMIFAGLGGAWLWHFLGYEIRNGTNIRNRFGNFVNNSYFVALLAVLFLLWVPINTYRDYFIRFAYAGKTQGTFAADLLSQGQYLASLPDDVQKFVIVNLSGDDIRGVPAPAQTIMFATDTFNAEQRSRKNLHYVREVAEIQIPTGEKAIIVPMNPRDGALLGELLAKYPFLRMRALGDFITLER